MSTTTIQNDLTWHFTEEDPAPYEAIVLAAFGQRAKYSLWLAYRDKATGYWREPSGAVLDPPPHHWVSLDDIMLP